ncbi:unnamed protein product [Ceutorhynchus assimilis]|uniref:UDP-glucuronosyltransferase n=1 Tax=Ceutorhynchus assimilis TaxID=467358 RepID=A0A9N9QQB1_9CUCU|nr:unnamed protein product [Ceutorhynchus assimilis]
MQLNLTFLVFAAILINSSQCLRILTVFFSPGMSHYILGSKLVKGLLNAGHEVTMISPFEMKDVPKNGTLKDIVLTELSEQFQNSRTTNNMFNIGDQGLIDMIKMMTKMFVDYSNNTIHHPKVQKLLKSNQKFDLVIQEQFNNDGLKAFAHFYNCPLITLSSMGPNAWVNPTVGNPQPVSYAPHLLLGDFSKDLSFINRAKNLFMFFADYLLTTLYVLPSHEEYMLQAFPNSPPISELYTNVSLVLLNSHTSIYPALPIVPNMVEIGGYFIDPPKKLPKELQEYLDNAKDGVVYFSMGSNLRSKDMASERKQLIVNVLGKLKEKVLWKFEEDLPGTPANIMIQTWLPQQDVLAHPSIKLFITHGGLLSTTETIYHGVPVLAIPVFGDQDSNADRAVASGFGLKLSYNDPNFTEQSLAEKINELLRNPKYKENAKLRSNLFHDRPMTPMETAVYWVEYVARHRGAPHLSVAGKNLPWYKYFMVDVLGAILLIVLSVLWFITFVFEKVFFRNREQQRKRSKKQKTN